jgi:hypothetical protein
VSMSRSSRPGPLPTAADLGVERVDWAELGPEFIRAWGWPDGQFIPEHLTVYGKSRSGKTFFVREVLLMRAEMRGSDIVMVATKKADRTLTATGWPIIDEWPPDFGVHQSIFWAKAKGLGPEARVPQRAKVRKLMDALWTPNSNTVIYWDELTYVEVSLKLKTELETFYREGAGQGITNVASMQRPSNVTRLSHSESSWTAAFPPKDADDRDRIAEVLGDRALFRQVLAPGVLDKTKREFILRYDTTGDTYITHIPPRQTGGTGRAPGSVHSAQR